MQPIFIIVIAVFVFIVTLAAILKRYKRCPSDKILVIYGKTGKNKSGGVSSARCIHGGAAFIWPVFQSYAFLDLQPYERAQQAEHPCRCSMPIHSRYFDRA